MEGKPVVFGSADPTFRGDVTKHNPEELLIGALSACHMLWYLHLCSEASIVVTQYVDQASGTMVETSDGGGHFIEAVLKPVVTLAPGTNVQQAEELHQQAHSLCFLANSMNFPVLCEPSIKG
ncbi:MAG: OsmC family protein [Cyanobacteria bacterium P01_F01_bin.153]